ncbi:hypothetical protein J4218_06905 [Candidatus Pacearchaeota archaeon]|nr:hypothetical protein [Candidatus Pacearchaeota archaeon]
MKFEEYLKALEIRKDTSKENYDYLYGEFGVGDNYDIALEAPFLEIISYFKNSPRWAYAGATGTLDERVSPDSSGLKGKVKKWEEEISHRIDNERRRIQEEMRKTIPPQERDDAKLWDRAYKEAKRKFNEGKIHAHIPIYFNSLDFHVTCQVFDLPYKGGMPHLGERNPEAFARYNQRVQQRNYRTHIMLHPRDRGDSQNEEKDQDINGANTIIQISNELIVPNRIPAVFPESNGSNHIYDFDRIVFYDPKIKGEK